MRNHMSKWVALILAFVSLLSCTVWTSAENKMDVNLSNYKTLSVGSIGPEVAALKQQMFELGYFKTNTVNESFTATTAEYVKEFERKNGLHVDGIADPEMQALFFSDAARRADGTLASPELRAAETEAALAKKEKEKEEREREKRQRIESYFANIDLSQYKTLTVGCTGSEVAALKQRMYELEYFNATLAQYYDSYPADSYTKYTDLYVSVFERVNGLPVDGIADPEMQALIFSDLALKSNGSPEIPEPVAPLTAEEKEKEVNQRFSDFLNGVGDFEKAKINNKLMRNDGCFIDLGYYHIESGSSCKIQAILLASENGEANQYLALGVKDKKKERKIFVVKMPLDRMLERGDVVFNARNGNVWTLTYFYTKEEIREFFEGRIGKWVYGGFICKDNGKVYSDEIIQSFKEYAISNISINLNFIAALLFPDLKTFSTDDKDIIKKIKDIKSQMNSITSLSGMLEIIENDKDCPIMSTFGYNVNEI